MQTETISVSCAACQRLNLPGGVRCIYCGTPYPPVVDFDLGLLPAPAVPVSPASPAAAVTPNTAAPADTAMQQGKKTGLLGSLALLLFKGKSLLALLKLGKVALTLSTMMISIGVYSRLYTWRFAIGFVICILIHELGHVVVFRRYGLKQTAPMFIPFVGALIFLRSFPENPTIESEGGAGGPIAGALAAFACVLIGNATHQPFWYALAASGFIINLFNLIPIMQLDGAHIISVFSPKVWNGVMLAMLLIALKAPVPMIWIILATNFMARISQLPSHRYLLARPVARLRMALVYMLLCVGLSYGIQITSNFRGTEIRPEIAGKRAARNTQPGNTDDTRVPVAARTQNEVNVNSGPPHPALTFRRSDTITIVIVALGTMGMVGGILWTLVSFLLARASGLPFRPRFLAPAASMVAVFALAIIVEKQLSVSWHDFLITVGAYFAAVLAALIYAAYQLAQQGKRKQTDLPYLLRLAGCLSWAGGGALFVAYVFDSWIAASVVGVSALVFLARYPWLAVSRAAEWANDLGEHVRAEKWLRRALAFSPEPTIQAQLWERLGRLCLLQDRGGIALEAQDAKETLLAANAIEGQPFAPTLSDLQQRASALLLLDRFDDALTCCERMLQPTPEGASGALRLLTVRLRLSRIALLRGWDDEAVAQSDWCLRASAQLSKNFTSRIHAGRAAALVGQGQVDAALLECREAGEGASETYIQAWIAAIEAQAHLLTGNVGQAEKEAQRATRLMPGNLQFRYWHGRVLLAQGHTEEGRILLTDMAAAFPLEHWGRAAKFALGAA